MSGQPRPQIGTGFDRRHYGERMAAAEPFVDKDSGAPVCGICPSLRLPAGAFDVLDRPSQDNPVDPADGYRYHCRTRVPACVHPDRVGLPAALCATAGVPVPEHSTANGPQAGIDPGALAQAPSDVTSLDDWLRRIITACEPDDLQSAIDAGQEQAANRFAAEEVVASLRRVLSDA